VQQNLKTMKFRESEPDYVNSDEIISDYRFYMQVFLEEREFDFEAISLS